MLCPLLPSLCDAGAFCRGSTSSGPGWLEPAPSVPFPAAYKRVTAIEDWSLAAPMTAYRMRHAHGLEEMEAQLRRHFLHSPLLQAAPAATEPAAAAAGAAGEPAAQPQAREGRLARLAAGAAALVGVFDAAAAEGRNPVEAVHAAAAAAAAGSSTGSASSASDASTPPAEPAAAGPSEEERFAAATYLTQLQQALAYQTAVHQWRRNKGDARAQVRE